MSVTIKTVRNGQTTTRPARLCDGLLDAGFGREAIVMTELLDYLARRHDSAYVVDSSGNVIAESHRVGGARVVVA